MKKLNVISSLIVAVLAYAMPAAHAANFECEGREVKAGSEWQPLVVAPITGESGGLRSVKETKAALNNQTWLEITFQEAENGQLSQGQLTLFQYAYSLGLMESVSIAASQKPDLLDIGKIYYLSGGSRSTNRYAVRCEVTE